MAPLDCVQFYISVEKIAVTKLIFSMRTERGGGVISWSRAESKSTLIDYHTRSLGSKTS